MIVYLHSEVDTVTFRTSLDFYHGAESAAVAGPLHGSRPVDRGGFAGGRSHGS